MAENGNTLDSHGAQRGSGATVDDSSPLLELSRTLFHHLGVIRRRLIFSIAFLTAFSLAGYAVSDAVLEALTARHPDLVTLVFLSPAEAFFARLKLAVALGFMASFPFLLGQIWSFVRPYLTRRQMIGAFLIIPLCYLLFLGGAAVAYFGLLPIALRFFLGFASTDLEPMLSVSPFVGFVLLIVLPMAVVFQMPVVVMFLARIGVLRPATLIEKRRYAILGFFVVGALLTPADVLSQVLMAIPLIGLYEMSILFARLAAPRDRG